MTTTRKSGSSLRGSPTSIRRRSRRALPPRSRMDRPARPLFSWSPMNSLAVAEIEGGVMFTLPMTGARIEAQWRNARPHDVHDCFVGLQRKCEMHETLVLGMESIRSGLASEYTVGAIEAYQRQTLIVERAILDSIYLALDLTLMPPNGIEWRSLFPAASDALLSVVNSIRWMIGLSPEDRVNLETCALAALGLRPTPHVCAG